MSLKKGRPTPTAIRRRGAELENALLGAAWDVLIEDGYAGFTYEAIAARADTSRPVLYRRWPQREDLLHATLKRFLQPIPVPDTGSLRADAFAYLHAANTGRASMSTILSVQLLDYFRDTGASFADLRRTLRGPGEPTGFTTIVERAVARGELAERTRLPRVVNLPFDLLRHDLMLTTRPVTAEVITEIVDEIWLPLLVEVLPRDVIS